MAVPFTLAELRAELHALGHPDVPDEVILHFLSNLQLPPPLPPHDHAPSPVSSSFPSSIPPAFPFPNCQAGSSSSSQVRVDSSSSSSSSLSSSSYDDDDDDDDDGRPKILPYATQSVPNDHTPRFNTRNEEFAATDGKDDNNDVEEKSVLLPIKEQENGEEISKYSLPGWLSVDRIAHRNTTTKCVHKPPDLQTASPRKLSSKVFRKVTTNSQTHNGNRLVGKNCDTKCTQHYRTPVKGKSSITHSPKKLPVSNKECLEHRHKDIKENNVQQHPSVLSESLAEKVRTCQNELDSLTRSRRSTRKETKEEQNIVMLNAKEFELGKGDFSLKNVVEICSKPESGYSSKERDEHWKSSTPLSTINHDKELIKLDKERQEGHRHSSSSRSSNESKQSSTGTTGFVGSCVDIKSQVSLSTRCSGTSCRKEVVFRRKKIDRVARFAEMQRIWKKDSFLKSTEGKRKSESYYRLFSAMHLSQEPDYAVTRARLQERQRPKEISREIDDGIASSMQGGS